MKKIVNLSAVLVAILALGVITEKITFARLTVDAASRDVWCVGVSGAEVCVDSSGNFIPTTTNVSDLGTSSLKFKNVYVAGAYSGATGVFSGQLGLQNISSTTLASTTPLAAGSLVFSTTYKVVCASTGTSVGSFISLSSITAVANTTVECDI